MISVSLLTMLQVSLVGLGVTLQIAAMRALRKDTNEGLTSQQAEDVSDPNPVDLGNPIKPTHVHVPREQVHDYYEIEKTPPGVRPADLLKTARVTYIHDVKTPHP